MSPAENRQYFGIRVTALSVLVLLPALFWMITGQVWEDFLITFRQAANLVQGNGLTYQPGELLHSFTSPLNVMVPVLMAWITGSVDYTIPLLLYNIVSVSCLAAGGMLTVNFLLKEGARNLPLWPVLLFPLILILSVRVTAFAVNGQEAGFWVLFLAISFIAAFRGYASSWLMAGIGWGGLMMTRPDSPLHITFFGILAILLPVASRRAELTGIVKTAATCTAVYLPWFTWTWWYYGTPVPHTVMAKSGAYKGFLDFGFSPVEWIQKGIGMLGAPFLPIYYEPVDWPVALGLVCAVSSLAVILAPAFTKDRLVRLSSGLFAGSLGYLEFMELTARSFPWYYVPPAYFGALALARIVQLQQERPKLTNRLLPAIMVLVMILSFAASIRQIEFQQRVVENGVRREVGLFLKEHVKPGEGIYLEPMGYIGYFSGARILDFPGLVAPETVAVRHEHEAGFLEVPAILKPAWMVLRPHEWEAMLELPGYNEQYRTVAIIDRRDEVRSEPFLPGRSFPFTDSAFVVLKRTKTAE